SPRVSSRSALPRPPAAHTPSLHDALPISAIADIAAVCVVMYDAGRISVAVKLCAVFVGHVCASDLGVNCRFSQSSSNSALSFSRSEEHTSELQSRFDLVCRLLLEKKNISQ